MSFTQKIIDVLVDYSDFLPRAARTAFGLGILATAYLTLRSSSPKRNTKANGSCARLWKDWWNTLRSCVRQIRVLLRRR